MVTGFPPKMKLKLYLLTQKDASGHDTYSAAVVCARSSAAAKLIHPSPGNLWESDSWAKSPSRVSADFLGYAAGHVREGGVVCASFHAG